MGSTPLGNGAAKFVVALMAIGEVVVGLIILSLPREAALMLVDAMLDTRGEIVARMLGVAVLALGITWWMARGAVERRLYAAGFLVYNLGVGALFGWTALGARAPVLPSVVCVVHLAAGLSFGLLALRDRR